MKRAQGMSIEFIVIAAIAVLILILVVGWSTGSLSRLFGTAKTYEESVTADDLSAFRLGCQSACLEVQQLVKTRSQWAGSNYCSKNLKGLKCWSEKVGIDCSNIYILTDGVRKNCAYDGICGEGKCCCEN